MDLADPNRAHLALELGKLAGGTLLLAVALGAGLRLLRRGGRQSAREHLNLVETLPIGPGKYVHLVQVLDGLYLIGAADRSLSLLGRLPRDQAHSLVRQEMAAGRSQGRKKRRQAPPSFQTELQRVMSLQERRRG